MPVMALNSENMQAVKRALIAFKSLAHLPSPTCVCGPESLCQMKRRFEANKLHVGPRQYLETRLTSSVGSSSATSWIEGQKRANGRQFVYIS